MARGMAHNDNVQLKLCARETLSRVIQCRSTTATSIHGAWRYTTPNETVFIIIIINL